MFNTEERLACQRLVELAIEEDLGTGGDVTSRAVIPADLDGAAVFVARSMGVLAGLPAAELVARAIEPRLRFEFIMREGARVQFGDRLARLSGPYRALLTAERTALNFVQHLSGVASLTRRYVDAVAGLPTRVHDTRKTLPGWRLLEKYAVRQGGGHNHRLGLHDGILIKDNHLAALANRQLAPVADSLREARARGELPAAFLEIEVDTLDQLDEALRLSPDIILLDNMSVDVLREAVRRRNALAPTVLLEATGGVTLHTVRTIAESGVERISVGALTHSAPALDVALDYEAV